jgi:hypothetical protein
MSFTFMLDIDQILTHLTLMYAVSLSVNWRCFRILIYCYRDFVMSCFHSTIANQKNLKTNLG